MDNQYTAQLLRCGRLLVTRIIQSLYYSPASRCLIQRKCR